MDQWQFFGSGSALDTFWIRIRIRKTNRATLYCNIKIKTAGKFLKIALFQNDLVSLKKNILILGQTRILVLIRTTDVG